MLCLSLLDSVYQLMQHISHTFRGYFVLLLNYGHSAEHASRAKWVRNRVSRSGAVSGGGKIGQSVSGAGPSWNRSRLNWPFEFHSNVIFLKFCDVTMYKVYSIQ